MSSGRMDAEVDRRIANASKAFGALRRAVFKDSNLTITTKRKVYKACVLSVLLYGSECWTPLRNHLNRLYAFHHRCIRTVLNITNKQQWEQRITSAMTRQKWGDPDTAADKVMKGRRLEWLGHIARMADHRIPKLTLDRPPGGPRKRWRDQICRDLKAIGVPELGWYREATLSRRGWHTTYSFGMEAVLDQQEVQEPAHQLNRVNCDVCGRSFRRESDRKRHKCIEERLKPVWEQQDAVQCRTCQRWFRSRGGLSVHRCRDSV